MSATAWIVGKWYRIEIAGAARRFKVLNRNVATNALYVIWDDGFETWTFIPDVRTAKADPL